MPLIFDERPRANARLRTQPAVAGVVSWNTSASHGALAVRVRFDDESWSETLPYVRWDERSRMSLGGRDRNARFETDVLMTKQPFTAIEVEAPIKLDALALATPPQQRPHDGRLEPIELDVPMRSQYVGDPGRGWCSPASLAMLLAANGVDIAVGEAAAATYDDAYHGTGNWAFNTAFASRFRLRSFVAFLRDLAHARLFLAAGVPLALSFAWKKGELDNPPLDESDGHIVVLRGFDAGGNPVFNDPAQPTIRTIYPRRQFEKLWLEHRGVAYVIAPPDKPTVELANA
jgi:hypothetical protein